MESRGLSSHQLPVLALYQPFLGLAEQPRPQLPPPPPPLPRHLALPPPPRPALLRASPSLHPGWACHCLHPLVNRAALGVDLEGSGHQAQAAPAEPLCLPPAFPPMPVPPAGFAGLTPEELRALEGHERQHLEARLQSLRNIHTLLDAAMLQINQYLTVLASLGYVCTGAGAHGGSLELPVRPPAPVPGLSLRPP